MRHFRTAIPREFRYAVGAICVAVGLVGHGMIADAWAGTSFSPSEPTAAAPGGDTAEIRLADSHGAANAEGATQPDPECLKKYRWQPKLREEKCGTAAAERTRLPGSSSPVERPERDGGNGGGNGGGGGGGY